MKPTLIVFARAPRLGRVKRRLARAIGDAAALAFHRRTLGRLLRAARDPRWRLRLALTPDGALLPGFACIGQGPGDLGRRMARALARAPAVLVGSDIPALGRGQIAAAFRALRSHDAVFGPARDGGFYLVGVRRAALARQAFKGVRWSSPHALADTRANLRCRVALVETLADVDDAESWRAQLRLTR